MMRYQICNIKYDSLNWLFFLWQSWDLTAVYFPLFFHSVTNNRIFTRAKKNQILAGLYMFYCSFVETSLIIFSFINIPSRATILPKLVVWVFPQYGVTIALVQGTQGGGRKVKRTLKLCDRPTSNLNIITRINLFDINRFFFCSLRLVLEGRIFSRMSTLGLLNRPTRDFTF